MGLFWQRVLAVLVKALTLSFDGSPVFGSMPFTQQVRHLGD
jgi:hypothetical protein